MRVRTAVLACAVAVVCGGAIVAVGLRTSRSERSVATAPHAESADAARAAHRDARLRTSGASAATRPRPEPRVPSPNAPRDPMIEHDETEGRASTEPTTTPAPAVRPAAESPPPTVWPALALLHHLLFVEPSARPAMRSMTRARVLAWFGEPSWHGRTDHGETLTYALPAARGYVSVTLAGDHVADVFAIGPITFTER